MFTPISTSVPTELLPVPVRNMYVLYLLDVSATDPNPIVLALDFRTRTLEVLK
jgi:hypothetical protein